MVELFLSLFYGTHWKVSSFQFLAIFIYLQRSNYHFAVLGKLICIYSFGTFALFGLLLEWK